MAHAQTEDLRLSIEPVSYVLPGETRLQAAAQMGDTVMAFWGNTRSDSNGLQAPTIYRQRIVGGRAIDEPVRLLDDSWFPSYQMSAGARSGLFYLIWNDRRPDSPGVYMMSFDRDGREVSGPVLLWDVRAVGLTVVAGATPDSTIAVILNIPRVGSQEGNTRIIRVDVNGTRTGIDARLDSVHVVRQIPYGSDGGAILILRNGSRSGLLPDGTPDPGHGRVMLPDGTLDPRIPVIDFQYPFLVLGDKSVLHADTIALSHYRSLFDTTTINKTRNERLHRAVFGSIILLAKGDGSTVVRWVEVSVGGMAWMRLYQAQLEADLTMDTVTLVSTVGYSWGRSCGGTTTTSLAVGKPGNNYHCSGQVAAGFSFSEICRIGANPPPRYFTLYASADSAMLDTSGIRPDWWCNGAASVHRVSVDTTSSIALVLDRMELILEAPIFPARPERAQFAPGIVQDRDRVYVSYQDTIGQRVVSLAPWSQDNDGVVVTSPIVPEIGRLGSAGPGGNWTVGGMWGRSTSVDVSTGFPAVVIYGQRYDSYTEPGGPNTFRREVYSVVIPSGFSWRTVTSEVQETGNYIERGRPCIESVSRTPDGVGMHVSYKIGCSQSRRIMVSIDTAGRTIYTVRDFLGNHNKVALVAIDTTQVLVVDGRSVTRYDRGSARNSFTIDSVAGNPRYMSLSEDRFLRYNTMAGNDSILSLTVFDLSGVRRAGCDVRLSAPATRASIVLNDKDSSIVLVNGTRNGVFATVVTAPDLLQRSTEVRVSHTEDSVGVVTAAMRGDSLYVVWEDFRNGGRDIYGTSVALPTAETSRISGSEPGIGSLEIYPNPTTGRAAVKIDLAQGTQVSISIIDARGAIVQKLEPGWLGAGEHRIELDLRGISTGAYGVIVRSDFGTWTCKGVVGD